MKFKVGDKVKVLKHDKIYCSTGLLKPGETFVIKSFENNEHINADNGCCVFCEDELELIPEEYKVGDVVLVNYSNSKFIERILEVGQVVQFETMSTNRENWTRWDKGAWCKESITKKFQPGEHIEHFQYKNPKYFPEPNKPQHIMLEEMGMYGSGLANMYRRKYSLGVDIAINKPSLKEKTMRKLSELPGKIRRAMSQEAKVLFQAGYQDGDGSWLSKAKDEAEDAMILERCDQMKSEFVENAKEELEIQKQEKED